MAGGTDAPTTKSRDSDFAFAASQPQASTTSGQAVSPLGLRPLGATGPRVSREAMAGRHGLIEKVLLPSLGGLIKALHAANLAGQIGPGEISLLGELQHWLLQLQVEHDQLGLTLKKPRAVKKKRAGKKK